MAEQEEDLHKVVRFAQQTWQVWPARLSPSSQFEQQAECCFTTFEQASKWSGLFNSCQSINNNSKYKRRTN